MIAAVAAVLLVAAACGEQDHDSTPTFEESLDPPGPRSTWCDEFESLDLPGDAPGVDIAGAPDELQVVLQLVAEMEAQPEPSTVDPLFDEEPAPLVEAMAIVDAWGRQHCGTAHPFCRLWTFVEAHFAAGRTALQVMRQLDDELIRYAPDEHIDAVKDYLVLRFASELGPVPSDYEDADGAAAIDTLDGWVASHC